MIIGGALSDSPRSRPDPHRFQRTWTWPARQWTEARGPCAGSRGWQLEKCNLSLLSLQDRTASARRGRGLIEAGNLGWVAGSIVAWKRLWQKRLEA